MKVYTKNAALCLLCAMMILVAFGSSAFALSTKTQAYYYTWYGSQNYEGYWYYWGDSTGSTIGDWPSQGIYSAKDPTIVNQHMRWLRDAGVGVIICDWDTSGSDMDKSLGVVINIAAQYGIQVCIMIEPFDITSIAQYNTDIQYLINTYGSKPALYRDPTRSNRPYIYIYSANTYTASAWSSLLASLRTSYNAVFLCDSTNHTFITNGGWDGYFIYDVNVATSTYASEVTWAANHSKLFVPPVTPGFDKVSVPSDTVLDRQHGAITTPVGVRP